MLEVRQSLHVDLKQTIFLNKDFGQPKDDNSYISMSGQIVSGPARSFLLHRLFSGKRETTLHAFLKLTYTSGPIVHTKQSILNRIWVILRWA